MVWLAVHERPAILPLPPTSGRYNATRAVPIGRKPFGCRYSHPACSGSEDRF